MDVIRHSLAGTCSPTWLFLNSRNKWKIYLMFPVPDIPKDAIKFEILMRSEPFKQNLCCENSIWGISLHFHHCHFILSHQDKWEDSMAPTAFAVMFHRVYFNFHCLPNSRQDALWKKKIYQPLFYQRSLIDVFWKSKFVSLYERLLLRQVVQEMN